MEDRLLITDEIWEELEPLVRQAKHPAGAPPEQSDREFIEAVLYLARAGTPLRDPRELGHWHNVYVRFRRWEKQGVWQELWHLVRKQGAQASPGSQKHLCRQHDSACSPPRQRSAQKKGRKLWDVLAGD
jgi:transposase